MKLKKIYEWAIQEGMNADPRGPSVIETRLKELKVRYQSSPDLEKESFDQESLKNPYSDTRILNGDPNLEVKCAIVGIDIDTSELLLVDRLNTKKKEKIDLAISHHPQGLAFANFYEVMDMQSDIFHSLGIPINISEGLVRERKRGQTQNPCG